MSVLLVLCQNDDTKGSREKDNDLQLTVHLQRVIITKLRQEICTAACKTCLYAIKEDNDRTNQVAKKKHL